MVPTIALSVILTSACASLPQRPARPAKSSLGCMQAVLRDQLPAPRQPTDSQPPDYQLHCLAAGFIARYCSVSEAYLASVGKEFKDLVSGGDAQWRDLRSDRHGIRCARAAGNDSELRQCCLQTAPEQKQ